MSTDSSSSELSNDWHVINAFTSNDESCNMELPNAQESETDIVITNQAETSPSTEDPGASESQILENEFKNMLHDYAKVVEDKFEKPGQQSDGSSSCSDIEVIEDNVDPNANVSAFDIAVQQISFASSTGFDTEHIIEAEDFPPIDISEIKTEPIRRDSSPGLANTRTQLADSGYVSIIEKKKPSDDSATTVFIKVWITVLAISAFSIYINYTTVCKDDLQEMLLQMKQLTETFREENSELRNQLLAEMNNKKLYSSLESQITELKDENLKLNQMLQDMILDLQKPQRHTESELLNKEVNKLRDQINVLKFDNEELQKQVAKFRYGGRATRSSADENIDGRKGFKRDDVVPDGKSDGKDKSSDVPGDKSDNKDNEQDISTGDVNKLHQELLLEIEKIKQWNEIVEDISKQLHKPEAEKVKRWTFQDMRQSFDNIVHDAQKNIADMVNKFQKMNVSDMLAESIKDKNGEAKKVIENIKQYLKTTKEKTIPERINKAWNAMDKEWNGIKKFFGWTKDKSKDKAMHKENNHEHEDHIKNIHDKSDGENWYFKKKHEASEADINSKNKDKSHDSWMFERAAYRAKERKEDESINWYLKRKKYHERNNLYGQEVTDEDRYQHY